MSIVREQNGSQVLPCAGDPRATVNEWQAHLATDPDLRAKHPIWASLAARLHVYPDNTDPQHRNPRRTP